VSSNPNAQLDISGFGSKINLMNLDSAVFYSSDADKVVSFYRDTLGFQVDYIQEGRFASFIFPNGARLGIKTSREEREIPGHQTVFISVSNIEKVYELLKSKRLTFNKELNSQSWGKEFSILDPDANKVLFIERPS